MMNGAKSQIVQWPDWIKPALDQRFLEREKEAAKLAETEELDQRLEEITNRLKRELTSDQFGLILEWEEIVNHRDTLEMEWLYFTGLKEGLYIWKHLLGNFPD
jgi:hypothetical protein